MIHLQDDQHTGSEGEGEEYDADDDADDEYMDTDDIDDDQVTFEMTGRQLRYHSLKIKYE